MPITRALLDAQQHNSAKEKHSANNLRCVCTKQQLSMLCGRMRSDSTTRAVSTLASGARREQRIGCAPYAQLQHIGVFHIHRTVALRHSHAVHHRFFEETMRSRAENPNSLMESMHLRKYMEQMYRQERQASSAVQQDQAALAASRATFRSAEVSLGKGGCGGA